MSAEWCVKDLEKSRRALACVKKHRPTWHGVTLTNAVDFCIQILEMDNAQAHRSGKTLRECLDLIRDIDSKMSEFTEAIEFKLRYERTGAHIRLTIFAGPSGFTLANCGDLHVTSDEWETIRGILVKGAEILDVKLSVEQIGTE